MHPFVLVLFSVWLVGSTLASTFSKGSVFYLPNGEISFKPELLKSSGGLKSAARATFNDTILENGWSVLNVQTDPSFSDRDQLYAAGYIECQLTAKYIYDAYVTYMDYYFSDSPPTQELIDWLNTQDAWVRTMTSGNYSDLSPFWQQASLLVQQFDGCLQGYQSSGQPDIGVFGLQLLNDLGDIEELFIVTDPSARVNWFQLSPEEFRLKFHQRGRCSALVKLTGDLSEIFSGHSTWFSYAAMLRVYKHYNFPTQSKVAAQRTSFSSYPALFSSLDDFYMMDSGLVMLQTTNSVFNEDLFKLVVPESLLAWQRVRIANSLASSGKEWSDYVSRYNSGTYNNQYMVIDHKLWKPNQPLQKNLLWVVEQIPGLMMSADQTQILKFGYWPSYNIPFYKEIYDLAGYNQAVDMMGTDYSYDLEPRAQIFRRDQTNVTTLDGFKDILRYNNYLEDPYSDGSPWSTICSRGDLTKVMATPSGCYDTKVTYSPWVSSLRSDAISGPTTSNGLEPWAWTSEWEDTAHPGQPDVFDFDFVPMAPDQESF